MTDIMFYDCTKIREEYTEIINKNNNNLNKFVNRLNHNKWEKISANPSPIAIQMLRENPNKINWYELSRNRSPKAIQLLRENPNKIDWSNLSQNYSSEAIQLLRENPDKIDWNLLIKYNKNAYQIVCPYDYAAITRWVAGPFRAELLERTLRPKR